MILIGRSGITIQLHLARQQVGSILDKSQMVWETIRIVENIFPNPIFFSYGYKKEREEITVSKMKLNPRTVIVEV